MAPVSALAGMTLSLCYDYTPFKLMDFRDIGKSALLFSKEDLPRNQDKSHALLVTTVLIIPAI